MIIGKIAKRVADARWQMRVRKLVARGDPVPFSHAGREYFLNPDKAAAYHIQNSSKKIARMAALVEGDPQVVFDIGANCGLFSAFVAQLKPGAKIYAFEPSADLIPVIERNCAGLDVSVEPLAVGEKNERLTLFVNPDSQQTNSFRRDAVTIVSGEGEILEKEVECVSLDSFAGQRGIPKIDVLKVDVQGFEGAVFKGARELMPRVGQLFIESTWMDIESILEVVPLAIDYGFTHAAVVNPVLMGADLLLAREPIAESDNVHMVFELGEGILERRWI